MRFRSLSHLLLAAVVAAPAVAAAQEIPGPPTRNFPGTAYSSSPSDWQRKLDAAFERLRTGDWRAARRALGRLERDLREDLSPSRNAVAMVARLSLGRALVAAGEGASEDAIWHLDVAIALDATLAGDDLARHGVAGSRLAGLAAARVADLPQAVGGSPAPGFQPARELARSRASRADLDHPVLDGRYGDLAPTVIEYVVDAEGRPTSPRVLAASDLPTLTLALLDRLRDTRFEPALLDGRRVATRQRLQLGPVRFAEGVLDRDLWSSDARN